MFVIIREMSAGNESVGEMWQETKVFDDNTTLQAVMAWAEGSEGIGMQNDSGFSRKRIVITRPDNHKFPTPKQP
ncbi:MAG: hypothetical protein KME67_05225 [Candidatus Thiodiazotropha sp. (ex Codakia orbicularis)]|nr:hypothetical protein [Candidatus Thiodiazotropha sp. (ex Codakia orbicularis)]